MKSEFNTSYYAQQDRQRDEGIVCSKCGHTQIEHVFDKLGHIRDKSATCGKYQGPEDTYSNA